MLCYYINILEIKEQGKVFEFVGLIHTKQLSAASHHAGNTS